MHMKVRGFIFIFLMVLLISGTIFAVNIGAVQRQPPRIRGIAVTNQRINILDNANNEVIQLDHKGKLIRRISIALGDGSDSNSYALVASSKGLLYVVSNRAGIRVITWNGRIHPYIPSLGEYTDRIMAVDSVGRFYYPDKEQNKVNIYNLPMLINIASETKSVIASPEEVERMDHELEENGPGVVNIQKDHPSIMIDGNVTGPAHLGHPHKVCVPDYEHVWVLDQSYKFKVFRWEQKDCYLRFVREIKAPDKKNRSFTDVVGIESDGDYTYVACGETKSILKYDDHSGKLKKIIPLGRWPSGFDLDDEGRMYVGDDLGEGQSVIRVLSPSGKLLNTIKIP